MTPDETRQDQMRQDRQEENWKRLDKTGQISCGEKNKTKQSMSDVEVTDPYDSSQVALIKHKLRPEDMQRQTSPKSPIGPL